MAQLPATPSPVSAPDTASAPAPALDCAAVAIERTELQGLHTQTRRSISNLAFNRPQKRRKVGAGDVGRAAAGTAASILLPFGIGLALNAVTGAATRGGRKNGPSEPQPDIIEMIDRQHAIEARLAELAAMPCATAPAPSAPSPAATTPSE